MKVTSIDTNKLIELCNTVRNYKELPYRVRQQLVESLLKTADVIRQTDIENLVCMECAAKIRGTHRNTIFRMAQNGRIKTIKLCHKDYFDREEIKLLPPLGELRGQRIRR